MEKVIISFLVLLFYTKSFCQNQIVIKINKEKYTKEAVRNLQLRYYYTKDKIDSLQIIYPRPEFKYLTSYEFKDLHVISIPVFSINKEAVINDKINFINFIKFDQNYENQYYNVYRKNKMLMFTKYFDSKNPDLTVYSLVESNIENPVMYGSVEGFLMKLMLEKKYFVFKIQCFVDCYFIYDKKRIYAIHTPSNEGTYIKTEINEFMAKYIKEKRLKRIIENKPSSYFNKNTDGPNIEKYFKEKYVVKLMFE